MQVILLERIDKLGQMGDLVDVKPGYARNFLFPRKKALRATKESKAFFESQKAQLEAHNLVQRKEAEAIAKKMEKLTVVIIRQAGETGNLYGSVSIRDIAEAVTAAKFTVSKQQVSLNKPIKLLGIHPVKISLHPEVTVNVFVNVAKSLEEAAIQEKAGQVTEQKEVVKETLDDMLTKFDHSQTQEEIPAV
ncbi:MAG: 50S ribosomal protein L9 [Alphaproteobacteria bacterium]|nr:50S ribosomal protein L9 [Alphaproteobacteria bacterium]